MSTPTLVQPFSPRRENRFTDRERRLFLALAIVLALNVTVVSGALTFIGLLFAP
jgi:hypothetical protein